MLLEIWTEKKKKKWKKWKKKKKKDFILFIQNTWSAAQATQNNKTTNILYKEFQAL